MDQQQRPSVIQWLRYALTGSAPAELHDWVVRDVTGPTWVLRHIERCMLQLALPIIAVMVWMPATLPIRAGAAMAGTLLSLFYCLAYSVELTDRRLTKAGHSNGEAERMRRLRVYGPDAD